MNLGAISPGALNYAISPPLADRPDVAFAVIVLSCAIATFTDLKIGKIKNILTLPVLLLGLIAASVFSGWEGFMLALQGVGLALVAFGVLYAAGMLGAGDVKLLMALSAWAGPAFALSAALMSVFVGAILAVFQLAIKGRLGSFLKRMYRFVLTLLVKDLELEKPKIDKKLTFPFAVPIAIAGIWTFIENPLKKWGIL